MKVIATHYLAAVALATLAFDAVGQRIPTDIELKAAYCMALTKVLIDRMEPTDAFPAAQQAEIRKDASDRLNRLTLYLTPRPRVISHVRQLGHATAQWQNTSSPMHR
jgi:hypothetical protein